MFGLARSLRVRRNRNPRPCHLRLEVLEDRTLPAVTLGTGFAAVDSTNNQIAAVPPDTIAAVGPSHVVEAVNSAVAVYTKAGALVSLQPLATFFAPAGPSSQNDLFDPFVFYDDIAGRFVVGTLDVNFNARTSNVLFAVSNTSDPTQGFTEMHKVNTKEGSGGRAKWSDFPRVGYNASTYTFDFNMFSFSSNSFSQVQSLRINKASVLDANNATFTTYKTDIPYNNVNFTLVPARQHGAAATDPVWLVEENGYQNGGALRVARMTNANSNSPTITYFTVAVPAYAGPPAAASPGGVSMDAGDSRVLDAALRGGRLIVTQTVGSGGVANARVYEINVSGTPTLTQTLNTTTGGSGVHTYYPSADINAAGTIGWTYMRSSATDFISMVVGGQVANSGTDTGVVAQAGEVVYSSFDGAPKRAGDYSGTSVDPVDGSFWSANEYAKNDGSTVATWGTHVRNFTISASTASPLPVTPAGGSSGQPGRGHPIREDDPIVILSVVEHGGLGTLLGATGRHRDHPSWVYDAAFQDFPAGAV